MAPNEMMVGGMEQLSLGGDRTWLREWLHEYLRFHDHLVQFSDVQEPMRRPARRSARNRQEAGAAETA
jgi:hypothetical protein